MKITSSFILVEIEGDEKLRQVVLTKQQQQFLIQLIPAIAGGDDGVTKIMESEISTVAIGRCNEH